jgi:predicted amidohydrolase
MQLLCCQLEIAWEDKPANTARVAALLAAAKPPPGSLVVLPEMFATGFSMNVAGIGEAAPSPTEAFLAATAREQACFVLGGLVSIGADGRGRNEAVVCSPAGRPLARYAKLHPFTLGGESQHYAVGDQVVTFDWQGCMVAPFICYDLRFPEVFRAAVRRGAQLFIVIANWPAARLEHWTTLLRARAIENLAYVAGVNRCGADPQHSYPGRSLIVGPQGEVLAEAGSQQSIITAEIDLAKLAAWRQEFPALADLRANGARWNDGR